MHTLKNIFVTTFWIFDLIFKWYFDLKKEFDERKIYFGVCDSCPYFAIDCVNCSSMDNTNRTFIWIQHQSGLQLDPENTVKKMKSDSSNSSHNSRKKIIKESPDPPPRELVLASPDLVLKSGSRLSLETFRIYFDCLGPKRMLIENNRTR